LIGASLPFRRLGLLLAVVLALKLALLAAVGPAAFPDSTLYIQLGQEILDDPAWADDGGFASGNAPPRLLRPYGYPLLVALAKRVAGDHFGQLLAGLQTLVSVGVLAAAVVILSALSGFVLFDQALLTDSLYASLFIAVFVVLAAQMCGMFALRPAVAALLGTAWALSLTLRDVGLYHTVLPLAGLVVAGRRQRVSGRRLTADLGLFLLPVAAVVVLVVGWNWHRTGHAFFSITGGMNWLWPSVNLADRGLADPFACADVVCREAQVHGGRGMERVAAIAGALGHDYHLDPLQFGAVTFRHFLGVLTAHPFAFAASVAGNVQFAGLADLVFNPLANLNEFCRLHSAIGHRLIPGLRELVRALREGDLATLPWIVVSGLPNLLSIGGLALFSAGAPLAARRRWATNRDEATAILFLWAGSLVFVGSYAVVHMEMRHALPIVPLLLLATGWTVSGAGRISSCYRAVSTSLHRRTERP